jgi:hypothetical protein
MTMLDKAAKLSAPTIKERFESISEWCFPTAAEMPNDAQARCEWYARQLVLIANAARSAIQQIERQQA